MGLAASGGGVPSRPVRSRGRCGAHAVAAEVNGRFTWLRCSLRGVFEGIAGHL